MHWTPVRPGIADGICLWFDTTLVEIVERDGALDIGKYGILEVQTMDFHGTYKYAVKNLTDALRLHGDQFHAVVRANEGRWISERIEGPNIANVFKRTFYQVMLKFELARKGAAAGTVLAIPQSVWDSWQPFLGAPIHKMTWSCHGRICCSITSTT